MGKWEKYKKKYKKEWESLSIFKGWLQLDADGESAFCKVCKTTLRAHKTDLQRHGQRPSHVANFKKMNPAPTQQKITNVLQITNENKDLELKLAAYIAIHASIKSVDHLSELLKINVKGALESLKLHRTKCTMLIKNVIASSFKANLIEDVGNSYYSLIIDESTDVAVCKYLCLCVRYYSKSMHKIVTNFLGLIQITSATADVLAGVIENFLTVNHLKPERLIGLGTDGANNLCGKNHSVYTILKKKSPKLQLVRCIAHSLHLCCGKASAVLPSSLDFLCKEIYNWFTNSPLRRAHYRETFDLFNINENVKFKQFMQLSDTRWLARANVIKVILDQWLEIKTHFNLVVQKEKSHMARILNEMLNDNALYLYLTVVYDVIIEVNVISGLFQHENADIFHVYGELYQLILKNLRIIVKPIFLGKLGEMSDLNFKNILEILDNELALIPVDAVDYGYKFRLALSNFNVNNEDLIIIKRRCRDFVLTLTKEICMRVPVNINLFNSIKYFSPNYCLKQNDRPHFENLPLDLLDAKIDKGIVAKQWDNLFAINWNLTENITSEDFWISYVLPHKNAGGDYVFKELAEFALSALSLPLSNATVERVFSLMSIFKTKIRNKINLPLLDALIRTKVHFQVYDICCKHFTPSKQMFEKFNANMYDHVVLKTNAQNIAGSSSSLSADETEVIETYEILDNINKDYFDM